MGQKEAKRSDLNPYLKNHCSVELSDQGGLRNIKEVLFCNNTFHADTVK